MSALAALEELKACRYLSETALSDLDAVRSALEEVESSWPALPDPGREMWREIQAVLSGRGFLSLAGQKAARKSLRRALSHEIVHAHLYATGDSSTNHGPAFQAVLRRLADEGAFSGVVADDDGRLRLRAWLDAEAARLDAENTAMTREGDAVARERAELEQAWANLQAGAHDAAVLAAFEARRDAYNHRVSEASARAERGRADLEAFNREVERYNLMLVYPDGIDDEDLVELRPPAAAAPAAGDDRRLPGASP